MAMPQQLREIHEDLKNRVVWLHAEWEIYGQLYRRSDKRVDLLNETAGFFFAMLQKLLLEHTALAVSRLTERIEIGGRENLVLKQLIDRLDPQAHGPLVDALREQLAQVEDLCDPFRKIRNRRVAHADLLASLKAEENPVPGISPEMVEAAFEAIRQFMNRFEMHFGEPETVYEHVTVAGGDGDTLVGALKRSVEFRLAVERGDIPQDWVLNSKYRGV